MTISELIHELEEAKKYLGNCCVRFYYDNEYTIIDEFSLIKAPNTMLGEILSTHKCDILLKHK